MHSRSACGCLAVLITGCQSFVTRDAKPTVKLNLVTASQFNHRGMVQNEEWVLVPDISARLTPVRAYPTDEGGTFRVQSKGYLNLTEDTGDAWFPDGQGGKFSEIDLKADYSRRFEVLSWPIDVAAGVLSYVLPNASFFPNGPRGSTTEVFGNLGSPFFSDKIYSFYPHFAVNYDPDEGDGFYFNAGVGKAVLIAEVLDIFGLKPSGGFAAKAVDSLSFQVDLAVGYSSSRHSFWTYGIREEGFADFTGIGTLSCKLDENTVVSIGVGGASILDEDLRDWFDTINIENDNVWVSFGIGWEFGSTSS